MFEAFLHFVLMSSDVLSTWHVLLCFLQGDIGLPGPPGIPGPPVSEISWFVFINFPQSSVVCCWMFHTVHRIAAIITEVLQLYSVIKTLNIDLCGFHWFFCATTVCWLLYYTREVAEVQEIWHHWGPVKHGLFSSSRCDWQGKPGTRGEPGIPGEPVRCILRLSLSCQSTRHSFVTAIWHVGCFCSLTGWEGTTRRDRIPWARGTPRCSCKDAKLILLLFLTLMTRCCQSIVQQSLWTYCFFTP